jgi:hypothetical protein
VVRSFIINKQIVHARELFNEINDDFETHFEQNICPHKSHCF